MRAIHFVSPLLYLACSSSEPVDDGPLDPPPPEIGQQLATDTYRLAPGEEKYMCYQFYSPDERVAITSATTINAPGVHHIALYQAFGRTEHPDPHECEVLLKQTWLPIWGSGTSSATLDLPTGAAFIIEPGTQYIVQLHLQNATDETIDVRAGMNLTYDYNVDALQPAGLYAFGTFKMTVPPNAVDYQVPVSNCTTGLDMNVFALFPHMHKAGKKLVVTRSIDDGPAEPFYKIDPWSFGDQPMEKVNMTVGPNDRFDLTCHYDNPGDQPIEYGESSDQEMCFFVAFYYPYEGLGGCIIGG